MQVYNPSCLGGWGRKMVSLSSASDTEWAQEQPVEFNETVSKCKGNRSLYIAHSSPILLEHLQSLWAGNGAGFCLEFYCGLDMPPSYKKTSPSGCSCYVPELPVKQPRTLTWVFLLSFKLMEEYTDKVDNHSLPMWTVIDNSYCGTYVSDLFMSYQNGFLQKQRRNVLTDFPFCVSNNAHLLLLHSWPSLVQASCAHSLSGGANTANRIVGLNLDQSSLKL